MVNTRLNSSTISSKCNYSKEKILGSGTTTSVILPKELENITEIIKSLKGSGILINVVTKAIENEIEEERSRFILMWIGT